MSMKRSPIKKTPEKNRNTSISRISSASSAPLSNLYFCHFKNAMYMGGIKTFQKNGKGILLHDNGISMVSSYYNDLLHGHNIYFANHCLLSAQYSKNKLIEAAYRTDGFLLFTSYNLEGQLEGRSILLNYITKSAVYCHFKKGLMTQKIQETDYTIVNRIFDLGQIDFLIGKKHSKVLKYQFDKIDDISVYKAGNRLTIGFYKSSLINGLSFTFLIRGTHGGFNPDTHRNQDQFQLKLVERGYFINSQLNGFGQKYFKNGNLYIGELKNDVFQGNGILKNNIKKNWVSGLFDKGNLIDLIQYNNEGEDKKYDKIIQSLHQKRTNWINNEITIINFDQFDLQIQKIISTVPNMQVKTLEQRKQEVLRKIQQNFLCQTNTTNNFASSSYRDIEQFNGLKNSSLKSQNQSMRKFVRSFIPQNQSIGSIKQNKLNELTTTKINQSSTKKKYRQKERENSSQRKSSLRKSRIFQHKENNGSKSMDSFLKLKKVQTNNENKNESPTTEKKPWNFSRRKSEFLNDESKQINEGSSPVRYRNSSSNFNENSGQNQKGNLDSKRLIGKSRIFNYLNNEQPDITPKFNYNENVSLKHLNKEN